MPDRLTLRGLRAWTHLGITAQERSVEQPITIDLTWPMDATVVATHDDVARGIDYATVREQVLTLVQKERHTLELLAEELAQGLLAMFPMTEITVTVRKFALPAVEATELTITRPRA